MTKEMRRLCLMEELNELKEVFVEFGEVIKMAGDKMREFFTTTPWQIQLAALVMFVSFVLSIIIRLKFNYRTRGERRMTGSGSSGIIYKGETYKVYWVDNPKKGFTVGNSEGFLGTMEYLLVICIPVFLAFLTLLLTGGLQK